jgi:leucyl-tRNA---protein transferase
VQLSAGAPRALAGGNAELSDRYRHVWPPGFVRFSPQWRLHLPAILRRTLQRNTALTARVMELKFSHEHYALYRRYQASRHPGGGMDHDSREQYSHFLLQSNVHTRLVEFRDHGVLRMVSIMDQLDDGLSSVYTFYDATRPQQSLGTYSILWQIAEAKRRKLPFVYLGYWIKESRKMSYKVNFQPVEGLVRGQWTRIAATEK